MIFWNMLLLNGWHKVGEKNWKMTALICLIGFSLWHHSGVTCMCSFFLLVIISLVWTYSVAYDVTVFWCTFSLKKVHDLGFLATAYTRVIYVVVVCVSKGGGMRRRVIVTTQKLRSWWHTSQNHLMCKSESKTTYETPKRSGYRRKEK